MLFSPTAVPVIAPDSMPIDEHAVRNAAQRANILVEADEIINGDREETYGKFDKNLVAIADLWNTYIIAASKPDGTITISAKDVCMMMVLLKVAREANKHKRDNLVDGCGYFALAEKLEAKWAAEAAEEEQAAGEELANAIL